MLVATFIATWTQFFLLNFHRAEKMRSFFTTWIARRWWEWEMKITVIAISEQIFEEVSLDSCAKDCYSNCTVPRNKEDPLEISCQLFEMRTIKQVPVKCKWITLSVKMLLEFLAKMRHKKSVESQTNVCIAAIHINY